jgi:ubiquinol-cytochrome c reductase cytochrome b subunit
VARSWREWIAQRFGLEPIQKHVLDRRVAKGRWYYGDGAALLLLLSVQVATGGFLMLTYSPSIDQAYQSVVYITEHQRMGWFVRGMHYWSAGLMVVMLFVHLLRQVLVGGYKSPREGTWLIGVMLFFSVMTMSFIGYLLRWDERAIYALRVSLHMFHNVPLIGEHLVVFIQGGDEIGARTLTRLYAVHVFFIPLIMLMLAGWHLYLVIHHGVTTITERRQPVATVEQQREFYEQEKKSEKHGEVFFPTTALRSGAFGFVLLVIAVALTLAVGVPALMPEANLVERSYPAEEWWFWWYSGLIALLPPWAAPWFVVVFPIALFLVLVLLPLVDRRPHRGIRRRPVAVAVVVASAIALVYLSDLRRTDLRLKDGHRQSVWTGWPSDEPPPVPPGIELSETVEQGRILFAQYGCNSCHAIAGHGPGFGPDLAAMTQRMSAEELRRYVQRPPDGIPMPAYEGRMTEEEIDRVVEFVLVIQTSPREQ